MSHGGYRNSSNDLAYGEDYGKSQRWDRDRFERVRAKSRGAPRMSESFRFEEEDRFGRPGDRRTLEFDETLNRRGSRRPFDERERFFEEDRFGPRRPHRPEYLEEERFRPAGNELAPYKDRWDREYEIPSRPVRPSHFRRQSSWDAHDRMPVPRYGEEEQRQDLKLSVRVGSPRGHEEESRHREEESRHREEDFHYREEQPRYAREPEPYYGGYERHYPYREGPYEDHRDPHIVKEVEREIHRRAPSPPRIRRESESFEEISRAEARSQVRSEIHSETHSKFHEGHSEAAHLQKPKRGKTRMPKRLVQKRVILEQNYPFEETEDFFFVLRPLDKEQIDEVIKISERYKEEAARSTYKFEEEKKAIEAPPPPPPSFHEPLPQPPQEVKETFTTRVIENPTEEDYERLKHGTHEGHEIEHDSHHGSLHEGVLEGSHHGGFEEIHHGGGFVEHGSHAVQEAGSDHTEHGSEHSHHTKRSHVVAPSVHSVRSPSPRRESHHRGRSKSRHRSSHTSKSKSRRHSTYYYDDDVREEKIEDSGSIGGPLTLLVPGKHHNSRRSRDIKAEIEALEEEKRALRREREHEPEYELVEHKDRGNDLRIEKNRRAKSRARSAIRSKSRARSKSKIRAKSRVRNDDDDRLVNTALGTLT